MEKIARELAAHHGHDQDLCRRRKQPVRPVGDARLRARSQGTARRQAEALGALQWAFQNFGDYANPIPGSNLYLVITTPGVFHAMFTT